MNILHIYGQGFWHDEVFIYGDRESFIALRDILNNALQCQYQSSALMSTNDGEYYQVTAKILDSLKLKELKMPYRKIGEL
jgi:hypothetical protein